MAAETTLIDTLFSEQKELVGLLQGQGQLSFSQNVEAFLSKTLLLSIASYFESRVADAIKDYAARIANRDEGLTSLVRTKVIERQYHTYFSWRGKPPSVMPFFGMFGTGLRESAKVDLRSGELAQAAKDFLELGDLRNLLVHENFASYPLEMTSDEIYSRYLSALKFIVYVESKLNPPEIAVAQQTEVDDGSTPTQ